MAYFYYLNRLIELLKRDAVQYGEFQLSGGRVSSYYVDCRKVTLESDGAELVAGGVFGQLDGIKVIGGPTLGADPIVGATLVLASMWDVPIRGFIVRSVSKSHGTALMIEGPLNPEDVVAVVDDVATSGASLLRAIDAIEEFGCKVAKVIVILDRLEGAAEAIRSRGIEFKSLLTIRDLGIV